jgi:hypothetical protein
MIPVVPIPVFPYPSWDLVFGPDLRASTADRDVAADILCAAVADGRLTLAELDERLDGVLSARTIRELARLLSDLPDHRVPDPARFPGPARFSGLARPAARRAGSRMPTVPCVPAALRRPGTLGKPTLPGQAGGTASPPPARPRPPAGTRWSLLQSLVALAGCQ